LVACSTDNQTCTNPFAYYASFPEAYELDMNIAVCALWANGKHLMGLVWSPASQEQTFLYRLV
jgi:hypothetical protein